MLASQVMELVEEIQAMELTDSAIKEFLETAPLYSWQGFSRPARNRSSLWIREIDSFCESCAQVRPFQDCRSSGGGSGMAIKALSTGTSYLEFTCVSCGKSRREFLVEQVVNDDTIKLQKYGELPRKPLPRDPRLQKFLKDDLDYYEKGLVCLTNAYGIAAYAYFRRVVENNINRLLELIESDAKAISGKDLTVLEYACSDAPAGM